MRFEIKKHIRGPRSTAQELVAKKNAKHQMSMRVRELELRCARLEERLRADQDLRALLEQTRRRCTELEAKIGALTAASQRPAPKQPIAAMPSPNSKTERTLREFQRLTQETDEDALTLVGQKLKPIEQPPEAQAGHLRDADDAFSFDLPSLRAKPTNHADAPAHAAAPASQRERSSADLKLVAPTRPKVRRRILPLYDPRSGEYEIRQKWATIGRSKSNDIRVRNSSVSRKHARVREAANGLVIEDAGSTNGIFVNDERVDRAVLRNGDIISLGGHCELLYVEENLWP
jgi:hypothetical protein